MSFLPDDEPNPFRAPEARIGDYAVDPIDSVLGGEAESIRRRYIQHEADVRSIGGLYYLFLFFTVIFTIALITMGTGMIPMPQTNPANPSGNILRGVFLGLGIFYFLLSILLAFVAHGLRALQTWARWTAVGMTCFSFLGILVNSINAARNMSPIAGVITFVVSSLIPGLTLYILLASGNSVVFSASYKEVIRKTPYVKPGTSMVVKLILAIIVGSVLIGCIIGFINARN
jgi:hypothetical protein